VTREELSSVFVRFRAHFWKQLVESLFDSNFTKLATAEHHLGTTEYILMAIAVVGGLVGIGIAYAKYIKQNTVPTEDAAITGFSKVLYNKYMLMNFMTLFLLNLLISCLVFSETLYRNRFVSFSFGFGKVTNEISYQGKKIQNGSIGLYLLFSY
jgi:NADH-quinone oxidoreductase subunit L